MSVIIKGMNNPVEGLYYIGDNKMHKYKCEGGSVRTYNIIQLPEKHGKLIDINCLKSLLTEEQLNNLPYILLEE